MRSFSFEKLLVPLAGTFGWYHDLYRPLTGIFDKRKRALGETPPRRNVHAQRLSPEGICDEWPEDRRSRC